MKLFGFVEALRNIADAVRGAARAIDRHAERTVQQCGGQVRCRTAQGVRDGWSPQTYPCNSPRGHSGECAVIMGDEVLHPGDGLDATTGGKP